MMNSGRFDELSVDADQSEKLVKLLDAVVIKLEGGTDLDLQVLDAPIPPVVTEAKVIDIPFPSALVYSTLAKFMKKCLLPTEMVLKTEN